METTTNTRFDRILNSLASTRTKEGRRLRALSKVNEMNVDECCRAHTAFSDLQDLVKDSLRTGYRPSLYTTPRGSSVGAYERAFLAQKIADAYDAAMASHNRPERAFRGS